MIWILLRTVVIAVAESDQHMELTTWTLKIIPVQLDRHMYQS